MQRNQNDFYKIWFDRVCITEAGRIDKHCIKYIHQFARLVSVHRNFGDIGQSRVLAHTSTLLCLYVHNPATEDSHFELSALFPEFAKNTQPVKPRHSDCANFKSLRCECHVLYSIYHSTTTLETCSAAKDIKHPSFWMPLKTRWSFFELIRNPNPHHNQLNVIRSCGFALLFHCSC